MNEENNNTVIIKGQTYYKKKLLQNRLKLVVSAIITTMLFILIIVVRYNLQLTFFHKIILFISCIYLCMGSIIFFYYFICESKDLKDAITYCKNKEIA